MAKANAIVSDKFGIGEEKMAVLLQNHTFDECGRQRGNFYVVTCRR